MATEYIRDFQGRIIGRIETDSAGNKVTRNFQGEILNKYDAKQNVTRDFRGRIMSYGDSSSSLKGKN